MKIYFASFTDPSIEVDAHVCRLEEGIQILDALRKTYPHHSVILRARIKRLFNREERYIGFGRDADTFIAELHNMEQSRAR